MCSNVHRQEREGGLMGVSGMVSVCITSADIAQLLRVLHESRIEIHNTVYLDDMRIRMQIR